jgi:aspartate aminotransferase-like enzyme
VVAIVHAEAATGGTNDLTAVSALTREHGCLLVVDAVASVGAEPVPVGGWGADAVVIGPQKGLAGPAGVSAVTLSERAWAAIGANPAAPRDSVLSLLDLRERWLVAGRSTLTGTPGSLETAAFAQALDRVDDEGLHAVIARHTAARVATRAALRAAGLSLWIDADAEAAPVATTVRLPAGSDTAAVLATARAAGASLLSVAAVGAGAGVVRIVHAGRGAAREPVLADLGALLTALGRDTADPLGAADAAWAASGRR